MTSRSATTRLLATLAFTLISLSAVKAAVNDPMPTDFVALPEGRSTLATYWYDRHQDGTWVKGQRRGDLTGDSQVAALRYSRYYQFSGIKIAPVAVLGFTEADVSGTLPAGIHRHRSGFGDIRLGATAWMIDDPAHRHYLGINVTTLWPSGRYENRELVNPGENRRRQVFMLGWIKGLGDSWTVEATPELAWYSDTDRSYPGNVQLKQSRTASFTSYLRYRFNPTLEGFVGYQANEGGETTLNGIAQNNPIHGRRHFVGGNWTVDADNRINLRYGADDSVYSGLKTTQELTARWLRLF
ncbi:MAG TPA: transporter [Rhodocyclaceae bacterium]|nr:transporter [Rhodocyclaceae bacterium]